MKVKDATCNTVIVAEALFVKLHQFAGALPAYRSVASGPQFLLPAWLINITLPSIKSKIELAYEMWSISESIHSTTAGKEIIVMENALYEQKATSKLLRHFHIVVLKSST